MNGWVREVYIHIYGRRSAEREQEREREREREREKARIHLFSLDVDLLPSVMLFKTCKFYDIPENHCAKMDWLWF